MRFSLNDILFTTGGFAIVLSILLIWQIVSVTGIIPSSIFPPANRVLSALFLEIADGKIGVALLATLERMLEGFAIASIIGVLVGLGIGSNVTISRSFDPLIQFLRPLPAVILIPLIILYLGLGDPVIVIPVIFGCIWPVVLNTIDGVRAVDSMYIATADEFKINGLRRFTKIIIPAIAPYVLSGMRVSLALAWIVSVTAEFISAVVKNGIGVLIFYQFNAGDLTSMYASIIAVAIVAYVVNRIFVIAQSRLVPWHGRWQQTQ